MCEFCRMHRGLSEADRQYFMRRLAQEEAAAKNSVDAVARDAHVQMARYYREQCAPTLGVEVAQVRVAS